jgi:hypothetical protein
VPRGIPNRTASLATPLLTAALLAFAGCGRAGDTRGSAVEREETRGGHHYRFQSRVEPHRVTLGDRATWSLSADLPPRSVSGLPLRDPADSSLDLIERGIPRASRQSGGVRWSHEFEVRGFTLVGDARDTLLFPPDTLFVDSLTQAATGAVQPDRGPLPTELRPIDIAVAALAALLVLAAIAWVVILIRDAIRRRRGLAAPESIVPPEPPEAILLRELGRLRDEAATLARDHFYDRLSLALRGYAASVTGIPALDLTTTELARELNRTGHVDRRHAETLVRTLRKSDLAKFARWEDPLGEARAALDEATSIAGSLVTAPPSATPSATAPGS